MTDWAAAVDMTRRLNEALPGWGWWYDVQCRLVRGTYRVQRAEEQPVPGGVFFGDSVEVEHVVSPEVRLVSALDLDVGVDSCLEEVIAIHMRAVARHDEDARRLRSAPAKWAEGHEGSWTIEVASAWWFAEGLTYHTATVEPPTLLGFPVQIL